MAPAGGPRPPTCNFLAPEGGLTYNVSVHRGPRFPQSAISEAPKCLEFGRLFLVFHTVSLPSSFLSLRIFQETAEQDEDANSLTSVICLSEEGRPMGATGVHPWPHLSFQTLLLLTQGDPPTLGPPSLQASTPQLWPLLVEVWLPRTERWREKRDNGRALYLFALG